jgi:hypothetical protein
MSREKLGRVGSHTECGRGETWYHVGEMNCDVVITDAAEAELAEAFSYIHERSPLKNALPWCGPTLQTPFLFDWIFFCGL